MSIWKKKNVFVISGLFFLIGTLCLAFLCDFKNEPMLEKKEEKFSNNVDKEMFGMYIENDDGEYVEYTNSNSFPSNSEYSLNIENSYCVDSKDNVVDNVIYSNNGKVTVTSNKTVYCYLYFDTVNMICERNTPLGSCLRSAKTAGFNSTMEAGLYRYQGEQGLVDNYVCFGTTNINECLSNTDAHMYRVIGVNSSGQVKIIKMELLDAFRWYVDNTETITWPLSEAYTNINGSSFLTNISYVPSGWYNAISTINWKYGSNTTFNTTASTLYSLENAWTTTTSAKVGLMYLHDYYYAYQSGGLNCSEYGDYADCQKSWIHMNQNDTNLPEDVFGAAELNQNIAYSYERTMSQYGQINGWNTGYAIYTIGAVINEVGIIRMSVRPVFYLTASVYYVSGSGTENDPFIIDMGADIEAPTITVSAIDNYYTSARLSITSNEESTYCVNTSSTIGNTSNCVLEGTISENSTIVSDAFSTSNTYYVHVKDNAGNETISEALDIKVLYQKVEYIQSTGTQYINTGVSAPNGFKVFAKFNPTSTTPNYLVGSHNLSSPYGRNGFGISSSRWELGAGNTYPQSSTTVQINTDYEAEASTIKGNSYLKLNGSTVASSTDSNTRSSSNILIFQEHWSLNDAASSLNAKLYYMKLYDNTEKLVRDFIPVYRISDNVIGLFDQENKVFYTNAGTGTFGKGSNIN